MDYTTIESEFLRPLCNAWINKIESSHNSKDRKAWKEVADECMMFYSQSASAMWNPAYSKRFWRGIKLPKFRVTINKAFEMVAIFGPNLFWEIPHRTVESKRFLNLPQELFGPTPQGQMLYQQVMQQMQMESVRDEAIALLMDRWLNYTPREQPGGGLAGHSQKAVIDGLIKGRGVTATRPYKMPGSGRNLTGSFRESPDDIYLDPDFDSVEDCQWMAIKHVDVHTEVESRFKLPAGSLKNKATLESSWNFSESNTDDSAASHRRSGSTNDLVVWYEVFSKGGLGVNGTSMDSEIRDHMDAVVGQFAYIAVCADIPYPLNMSSEQIRRGATDEDVKEAFSWPVPYWADDKWPVEFLDFYLDPESAWPVAPLAPGLGELKLLNFLMSWFANRTWSSSRDFWAVAQPHLEHYREYILSGDDQSIIPTPVGLKSPKEAIEILTQPEGRQDMTQLISFVSDMFDKRVGMTPTIYGQNENATQNRTAEETQAKQRAVMARPEYMQKQVVEWQSRIAQSEAFVTRLFVTDDDVRGLLGDGGAMLWRQYVMNTDIELVVRQFQYTISAASIRRPNRERDIGNFQQVMGQFAPVLAGYGQQTGDYGPWNGMVQEWAALHDADLDDILIPPPQQNEEQVAMEQQIQQLQVAELQAKVSKLNAEAQAKAVEAQIKPQEMQAEQVQAQVQLQTEQIRQQGEVIRQQGELARQQGEIARMRAEQEAKAREAQLEMIRDMAKHRQDMEQDAERHEQELEQKQEMAEIQLASKIRESQIQLESKKAQAKIQQEQAKKRAKGSGSGGDTKSPKGRRDNG
jgi:hypothetical protein